MLIKNISKPGEKPLVVMKPRDEQEKRSKSRIKKELKPIRGKKFRELVNPTVNQYFTSIGN